MRPRFEKGAGTFSLQETKAQHSIQINKSALPTPMLHTDQHRCEPGFRKVILFTVLLGIFEVHWQRWIFSANHGFSQEGSVMLEADNRTILGTCFQKLSAF